MLGKIIDHEDVVSSSSLIAIALFLADESCCTVHFYGSHVKLMVPTDMMSYINVRAWSPSIF